MFAFSPLGRLRWCVACLLCLLLAAPGLRAEAFAWDPTVVRGRLDNGFEYYLVRVPKASKQVGMQLVVRAGSIDERDQESGVAHMVEHMVFHASRRLLEGVDDLMQKQGWVVGRHYNATTNYARTQYMLALDNQPQRLAAGLLAFSEIAGGALIPEDGLERERPIILEEWRMKLGVRERMDRQRRALLRAGSLYPERTPIGTAQSIQTQSAAALREFYAAWYRPGNMALVIAGDIDPAQLVPQIEAQFAHLQAAPLPARNPTDPTLSDALRIARLQDAESGSSQVGWVYRFHTDKRQDSEGLRNRLLDRVAERMVRHAVRQQANGLPAMVESLSSSKGELGDTVESLGFVSSVAVGGHTEGLRQILTAQSRLLRQPLDADQLQREIDEILRLNGRGLIARDSRELTSWLQLLSDTFANGLVLQDAQQKQQVVEAIVPTLTAEAVQARIHQWLGSRDRLLFMTAPGLSPLVLPTPAQVAALQAEVAAAPLPALVAKAAATGQATLPQRSHAGQILSETTDAVSGVTEWQLSNGDRLVWLKTADAKLSFAVQSGAGYRLPGAASWEWQTAAQLAQNSEVDGQAAGSLARWQQERRITLSQDQTATRLGYKAQVEAEQLPDLLRLYALRQSTTTLPAEGLQRVARQFARQRARQPDSVNTQLAAALGALRFGADQPASTPTEEDIAALATDAGLVRLQARWQVLAAQPATYFLMGDVEPEALRNAVEHSLAGIARKPVPLPAQGLAQLPGSAERTLAIGVEPQASIRAHGHQAMDWSPQRAVGIAILSRVIYTTLRAELRDKESAVYRLGFDLKLDPQTQGLDSEVYFTADPQRVDALWARTKEMLATLPAHIDTAALAEELRRMRVQETQRRADAATRFQRLQLSYQQYGDARYLADSQHLLDAVTPDSLQALLQELKLTQDLRGVQLLPRPLP